MLYSINWPNFIEFDSDWIWLSLIAFTTKVLGNMCIAITCFPGCDVTNFKINLFNFNFYLN